jgi:hypothetical protein
MLVSAMPAIGNSHLQGYDACILLPSHTVNESP